MIDNKEEHQIALLTERRRRKILRAKIRHISETKLGTSQLSSSGLRSPLAGKEAIYTSWHGVLKVGRARAMN